MSAVAGDRSSLFEASVRDLFADPFGTAPTAATHQYPDSTRAFVTETLGDHLWSKQEEICDALDAHRFVAARSAHACGKSHVAARVAEAFLHRHERSIVVTTAPTNRQVKNVLWRYINAVYGRNKDKLLGRCLQMSHEIAADWYAIGFKGSNDNTDALQGFHATRLLLIVDEAAGVPEPVFDAADAILTGAGASCLLIGNPTSASGTFRRAFHQDRDLWHGITISAYDSPNFTAFGITRDDMLSGAWVDKVAGRPMPYPALIDPHWVARQIRRHGADSPFVISRVDAEFADDAGDTLIPLALIERADAAAGELVAAEGTRYEAGLDVARFGDDESSLTLRRGPEVHWQHSWSKASTTETTARTIHELTRYRIGPGDVTIKVDATGIGAGVADELREQGWDAVDVVFGAKSSDREKWPNLRHELWWQLRDRFHDGRIAPVAGAALDEVAMAQASDVKVKYDTRHTMPLIESKDEAKRRGVKSPDRAESWVLAFGQLPPGEKKPIGIVRTGSAKGRW